MIRELQSEIQQEKEQRAPQKKIWKIQKGIVKEILAYLNAVRIRCVYGVIGEAPEFPVRSLRHYLGKLHPEASWMVRKAIKNRPDKVTNAVGKDI